VEGLAVVGPSQELSLELVAWGQVRLFTVRIQKIDVIVLVASLIVCVEDARVGREVANAKSAFGRRASKLPGLTSADRDTIDVVDSAFVAGEQYGILVGRE